jgi:hypothetical protein
MVLYNHFHNAGSQILIFDNACLAEQLRQLAHDQFVLEGRYVVGKWMAVLACTF